MTTVAPPTEHEDNGNGNSKLQQAAEELAQLTPEGYLELLEYVEALQSGFPEARASVNFFGTTAAGWDCQFTLRDSSEGLLIKRFAELQKELQSKGVTPKGKTASYSAPQPSHSAPSQSTPAPAPAQSAPSPARETRIPGDYPPDEGQSNVDTFEVASVNHQIGNNGSHFLLCKGGKYTKWGWKAWEEVVPKTVNFENWPIGQDFAPPDELAVAWVDLEKKKIIQFGTSTS